ncbi:MAG: spore protease YyaC [Hydrogenibacillus schlegelii]|nr:spore protease YyaC [Hydrogenibacillus schlegelii]
MPAIHPDRPGGRSRLEAAIAEVLQGADGPWVFLCIGSDRSTGDSFGPLVGRFLRARGFPAPVYGTLEETIHAVNLDDALRAIRRHHPGARLFAVDASLGNPDDVGALSVGPGPVYPGRGVNKTLAPVGDAHLVGIVGPAGWMPFWVLQNTRLSLVWRLAEAAAQAIHGAWLRTVLPWPEAEDVSDDRATG